MCDLLRDQASRTTSRRELEACHEKFADVSGSVGALDAAALAGALADDPDAGVELLAAMARATDRELRRRARQLAAELLVPVARHSPAPQAPGVRRLGTAAGGGVELDVDATVERLASRPARPGPAGPAPHPADLRFRAWRRPGRAHVLVVDASGSVAGRPLSTAVVTAAALAVRLRPDDELAVVAFWSRAVVLRPVASAEPAAAVLDALFDLSGGDTTDLAGGLAAGLAEAERARAGRRDLLVLTDGMANAGGDPLPVASAAAGGTALHVLGLSAEAEAVGRCRAVAAAGGGRFAPLLSAGAAPAAVAEVLDGG